MTIEFACPHCGASLQAPEGAAGRQGRCRACGQTVVAPALPTASPPAPPPEPEAAVAPPPARTVVRPRQAPGRKRRVWMVLVAAVLVLGGVAGAVFYGHRRAPVPADPAAGAGARTVRSEDLLQFVCAQDRDWALYTIPVCHSGSGEREGSVSNKQMGQLGEIANGAGSWPYKLGAMAAITPLWVEIGCESQSPMPVEQVVAQFGPASQQTAGTILEIPSSSGFGLDKVRGTWHIYGSVRLGVVDNGTVRSVRVDGPAWRKEHGK